MNIKNKILAIIMSTVMCFVSITALKPNTTAKAWWWEYKNVIIWQKWADGGAATTWGPEPTYHIMFMDPDLDEYWIGDHVRWSSLTPYFNPRTTEVYTTVSVEKSFLDQLLYVS
jgi:hypothetical protein